MTNANRSVDEVRTSYRQSTGALAMIVDELVRAANAETDSSGKFFEEGADVVEQIANGLVYDGEATCKFLKRADVRDECSRNALRDQYVAAFTKRLQKLQKCWYEKQRFSFGWIVSISGTDDSLWERLIVKMWAK